MRAHSAACRPAAGSITGFTLIELLIAIAILATIFAMAIPSYQSALDEARNTRAIGEIKTIEKEILFFEATQRRLPSTLAEVGKGDAKDPWGNAYEYLNFEEALKASKGGGKGGPKTPPGARKDKNLHPINSSFDLYSMGKDGKSVAPLTAGPSQDDIVRANDGGFVGLGSDY